MDGVIAIASHAHGATDDNFVAWIALVVSLVTLVWQITITIVRWPRVSVILTKGVHVFVGTATPIVYTFSVTAINSGSEAVTVTDVGIAHQSTTSSIFSASFAQRHNGGKGVVGQRLPVRLEAHGSETWDIEGDAVPTVDGEAFRAYVTRYRPIAPGRLSPHDIKYSPNAETKGSPLP